MIVRWKFTDTKTAEVVTLPLNPNKMSTPTFSREATYYANSDGSFAGIDHGQSTPTAWSFQGVILAQAHHDLLLSWSQRGVVLRVDDHLGRTFGIIIEQFDPVERLPTATKAWRFDYTMSCLLLEEL